MQIGVKKMLSIIIPHWNDSYGVINLLKSIPDNYEIQVIIVDDNSDTVHINRIKAHIKNKTYIQLFNNETGIKGAGACRNIGLLKASKKWVLFADSDDLFTINFVDIIKFYIESENDIIFFAPTSIEEKSNVLSNRHIYYSELVEKYVSNPTMENETRLRFQYFPPWSKMYKRSFINENKIRFDEVIVSNDVMFSTISGFYAKKISGSLETIYTITKKKSSLTTIISYERFIVRVDIFIKNLNFLKKHLRRNQYRYISSSGIGFIIKSLQYRFGLKKTLTIYKKFRRNNIKVFSCKIFNPFYIYKRITDLIKDARYNKKYISHEKDQE